MRPWSAHDTLPLLTTLVLVWTAPAVGIASTAPTTPTFVLAWGNFGGAPAQFHFTAGAATDGLGNVYVVDASNNRIQKFDRHGNFILTWGTGGSGPGQFNGPVGVAVDRTGNVYVVDQINNRVQKFTPTGGYLTQWGSGGTGNGQFAAPFGVATDAAGNVYVADQSNHRIQKFTGVGGYLTQWGGSGVGNGQFILPLGVATDPAGNVYVTEAGNDRIQKFSGTGAHLAQWGGPGTGVGQFDQPVGLAIDAAGNVYVADTYNARIQKFSGTGTYLTQWGGLGGAHGQFNTPFALAVDPESNVYVADTYNHRIQKFSGAGAALAEPAPWFELLWGSFGFIGGYFRFPFGLATDAAGNVFVADYDNHWVQKFSGTGAYITHWGGGDGPFAHPHAVATDAAGNVYVADTSNDRIQKFSNAGNYLIQWGGSGGGAGQFNLPAGVATDASGNVYVADLANHRIQKFSETGAFIAQWGGLGSGNGQLNFPYGVATDAAGNVYVVDSGNHRIQKFTSAGGYIGQWGGPGGGAGQFNGPIGVSTDAAGNVYVVDTGNHRIQKFTGAGAYLTQWGSFGNGSGQFDNPLGLATDAAGNIFVSDRHRIQKFLAPPSVALVSDVRNDQGRSVRLRVLRSSADAPGSTVPIQRYDVFRRIDPLPGPASAPLAAGPSPRADLAGWDQVGTFSAYGESEYNVIVPTLADATAVSLEYSAFMVRAATASPFTFFDSGLEHGYSVDNLSPPAPTPFLAAYEDGGTHLHWGVSTASDFATFRLYRGASAQFVPGESNLVVATPDTGHVDVGSAGGYYKLSAVDRNGNESPFSLVTPSQTTDVTERDVAIAFGLEGVWPNPALGGRIVVHFALPSGAPASLELMDVAGRRVRERAVGALGAGRHAVDLAEGRRLEPGLYFVRLTQGANVRVARATLLD